MMEADTSNDFQDFWEEYKLQGQDPDEDDFGQRSSASGSASTSASGDDGAIPAFR